MTESLKQPLAEQPGNRSTEQALGQSAAQLGVIGQLARDSAGQATTITATVCAPQSSSVTVERREGWQWLSC
jgi:hypothetical protein